MTYFLYLLNFLKRNKAISFILFITISGIIITKNNNFLFSKFLFNPTALGKYITIDSYDVQGSFINKKIIIRNLAFSKNSMIIPYLIVRLSIFNLKKYQIEFENIVIPYLKNRIYIKSPNKKFYGELMLFKSTYSLQELNLIIPEELQISSHDLTEETTNPIEILKIKKTTSPILNVKMLNNGFIDKILYKENNSKNNNLIQTKKINSKFLAFNIIDISLNKKLPASNPYYNYDIIFNINNIIPNFRNLFEYYGPTKSVLNGKLNILWKKNIDQKEKNITLPETRLTIKNFTLFSDIFNINIKSYIENITLDQYLSGNINLSIIDYKNLIKYLNSLYNNSIKKIVASYSTTTSNKLIKEIQENANIISNNFISFLSKINLEGPKSIDLRIIASRKPFQEVSINTSLSLVKAIRLFMDEFINNSYESLNKLNGFNPLTLY